MLVKICGLRDNFNEVLTLKPDFAGMIFYPKSPRYVPSDADRELKRKIYGTFKTGVFVNESFDRIIETVKEFNLDFVQLHGGESPEFCAKIREKIPVIKAFGISSPEDFFKTESYENCADYFLFDTKTESFGGSGRKFNWEMLSGINVPKKFLLSGGISPDDIPQIKNLKIKNLAGVDLNSRFELSPTEKNIEALRTAVKLLTIS